MAMPTQGPTRCTNETLGAPSASASAHHRAEWKIRAVQALAVQSLATFLWSAHSTIVVEPTTVTMDGHDGADEHAPLLPDRHRPASRPASAPAGDRLEEGAAVHWRSELALLLKYSLPLIATYLLQYSFFCITIWIAGHLGAEDLAAASVGSMTMNVFGLTILEGMATALDTLCAQAYGSGHKVGVGLHVQRMMLLMALSLLPVGLAWVFSPWILPLFVKQRHLAVKAGVFLQYSLVGLPGYGAFEAGKRFLQAQGDCNVGMVVLIICAPVNAALSYWLAFSMGMGLAGAALGSALTNNLRALLLFLYIISPLGKWSHVCWGGLDREALRNWRPMVSLSSAGVIVLIGEWAAFEILTFSTSYVSTDHLAAQTLLVCSWTPFLSLYQCYLCTAYAHVVCHKATNFVIDHRNSCRVAYSILHQRGLIYPHRSSDRWRFCRNRTTCHGSLFLDLPLGRNLQCRHPLFLPVPDSVRLHPGSNHPRACSQVNVASRFVFDL
jgi:hypothetical protein